VGFATIVATPGALLALHSAGQCLGCVLLRHGDGDWGELDADDKRANEVALREGGRILSKYTVPGEEGDGAAQPVPHRTLHRLGTTNPVEADQADGEARSSAWERCEAVEGAVS
jgi:hypothetical protein